MGFIDQKRREKKKIKEREKKWRHVQVTSGKRPRRPPLPSSDYLLVCLPARIFCFARQKIRAEALTTLFLHRRYRLRGKYMGEVGELQAATVSCYFPVGAGRPAHGGSRTREMHTHTHKSHVYLHAQGQTQVNTHIHIQTQGTQNRIHTA